MINIYMNEIRIIYIYIYVCVCVCVCVDRLIDRTLAIKEKHTYKKKRHIIVIFLS